MGMPKMDGVYNGKPFLKWQKIGDTLILASTWKTTKGSLPVLGYIRSATAVTGAVPVRARWLGCCVFFSENRGLHQNGCVQKHGMFVTLNGYVYYIYIYTIYHVHRNDDEALNVGYPIIPPKKGIQIEFSREDIWGLKFTNGPNAISHLPHCSWIGSGKICKNWTMVWCIPLVVGNIQPQKKPD